MRNFKSEIIDKIFEYDNYRSFLKDYFDEQKEKRKVFTYRYFAQKAGFSAHNFCMRVIAGSRNLGSTSIPKMCNGLDLKGKRAKYFEALVKYNQTEDITIKQSLSNELETLRLSSNIFQHNKNEVQFFGKWYYPVIRELVVNSKWNEDFGFLASQVVPKISQHDASEAVKTMLKIGLIYRNEDGTYAHSQEFLSAENIPVVVKKKYRRDILSYGVEAVENFGPKERFTTVSTLAMSNSAYKEVVKIFSEAVEQALSVVATDSKPADKIYHIATNIFPASAEIYNKER